MHEREILNGLFIPVMFITGFLKLNLDKGEIICKHMHS